jgi:prepilin-type N-terminal cleavage/methylation domain-containing protein
MLILTRSETAKSCKGFALIEVLVAASIASIVVLSVYSGVITGAMSVQKNAKLTRAIIIAKNKLAEYRMNEMRGTDLLSEQVKEYPDFRFTRVTERYENSLFSALPAKKTTITVEWDGKNSYSLYTVYIEQ